MLRQVIRTVSTVVQRVNEAQWFVPEYLISAYNVRVFPFSVALLQQTSLVICKISMAIIFGPKKAEVTDGKKTLYKDERHNLYSPLYIVRDQMKETR
jgi:hypothetical protein